MKTAILFVLFSLFLNCLEPTEAQRDGTEQVRIPPMISSIFPEKYYMPYIRSGWNMVIYKCDQYSGIPPPEITWQYFLNGVLQHWSYNDHLLKSYNGSQLKLKIIKPNEQFQCKATNAYGTALSTKIRIYQADGASFNDSMKNTPIMYSAKVGEPLLIPCLYNWEGIPEGIFFWKVTADGSEKSLPLEDRIFISDNGSLVFSYVKLSDGGNNVYTCNIQNKVLNMVKYGSWTRLDIQGSSDVPDSPATLIYSTKNHTVAEYKKPFTMQCIFGGKPVPEVKWERPFSNQFSNRFSKNRNNEMIISSVLEEDEGVYKCTSDRKLGNPMTISFFIDVKGPPIWVKKPMSLLISEGQDGVIHCDARPLKNEKPLQVPKWFKNGKLLSINPGGIDGRTELSMDGKTLTIHDAQKSTDICNYQCSVSNDQGEIFADAAFNVILNTEILVAPESQTIDKGEVVMFNIRAITDPLKEKVMTYTWMLNGRKIEFLDLYDIYLLQNYSLVVNTTGMDENRFKVILGNYSVNVNNGVEVVTRYASLMGYPVKNPVVSQSGMDLRWIALIVAVVLLFIIFILLLCVVFNRHGGDDYSVDKKERKAGHDPEKELADSGFHDLPRADDDPDRQKPDNVSISSTAKSMGSETDSMEEYSDADAGSRFNEDGSFIGAYQGHESKGNHSNV